MSFQAISWSYQQKCSPTQKFILVTLANFAGMGGETYPSINYLSDATGFSRRTVINALSDLEILGLISKEARYTKKGGQTSNLYRINGGHVVENWGAPDAQEGAGDARGGAANNTPPSAGDAPNTSLLHTGLYTNPPISPQTPKKKKWQPPENLNLEAWNEFEEYRKEIRKNLTDRGRTKNANVLKKYSPEDQQAIVDASIASRWPGLYPLKNGKNVISPPKDTDPQSIAARILAAERAKEQTSDYLEGEFQYA